MNEMFDMHCHIIPSVDDGAKSLELSLKMLQVEYSAGVRHVILTPHYRRGMFETDRDTVEKKYGELKEAAARELPDLRLYLGCEYHSDGELVERVRSDYRYRMNGGRHVLLEFSEGDSQKYIKEKVYKLRSAGFVPAIAHIERYSACNKDLDFVAELGRLGCLIQVNADSLIGKDGRQAKKFSRDLVKEDLLDLIGSDGHNLTSRPVRIEECRKWLEKKAGSGYAKWIFCQRPAELLR